MQLPKLATVVVCSAVLAAPSSVWAQSPSSTTTNQTSGTGAASDQLGGTKVHGTVADPSGAVIPGAQVTFTPSKGSARTVKSGSDGTYSISVAPGAYTLVVSMQGFASYSMVNLRIPAVPSTTIDAKLTVGGNHPGRERRGQFGGTHGRSGFERQLDRDLGQGPRSA